MNNNKKIINLPMAQFGYEFDICMHPYAIKYTYVPVDRAMYEKALEMTWEELEAAKWEAMDNGSRKPVRAAIAAAKVMKLIKTHQK
jgi:hypothetical protein